VKKNEGDKQQSGRVEGRVAGKVAVVAGGGQTPGDTIGNGRATAILLAREGAEVVVVDRRIESARGTVAMIEAEGGNAWALAGDVASEPDCERLVGETLERSGQINILHNNVGIGGSDAGPAHIGEEAWDRILSVNLKSVMLTCKHVLPVMRSQGSGSITNVSSIAAVCSVGIVAYKVSKAGINAYTQSVAVGNAKYGVRANVIMPGLMNTPMAIEGITQALDVSKEDLIRRRDAQVPLRGKMGTGWDVAYAALFLNSEEAKFITGVALPVDGGQSARIG